MKFSGVLLSLLLALFYSAGYFICFHAGQNQLKKTASQRFRIKKEIIFTFTQKEFNQYLVNDHEFVLDGVWHDIEELTKDGDLVIVRCHRDDRETAFVKAMAGIFGGSHADTLPFSSSLFHLLTSLFLQDIPDSDITRSPRLTALGSSLLLPDSNPAADVPSPPPDRFC